MNLCSIQLPPRSAEFGQLPSAAFDPPLKLFGDWGVVQRAKGMSIPQDQCTQNEFQTKALKRESFDSVDNHHYFLWCSNICHCVLKTHKESTHCFKSRGLSRLDLPTSGILVAARGDPTAPPSLESIAILDLFLPFLGEGFRGSALDFWILVAMIMLSCELFAHCQCH